MLSVPPYGNFSEYPTYTRPISQVLFQLYSLTHEILKRNSVLIDDDDDDMEDLDDVENILESLREGKEIGAAVAGSRSRTCKGGIILGILAHRLTTLAGDLTARALLCLICGCIMAKSMIPMGSS